MTADRRTMGPASHRFESAVALTGIGRSEFRGTALTRIWSRQATEAARTAIADAGLSITEIDGCASTAARPVPGTR